MIQPIHDRVVVKRLPKPEKAVVIPDEFKEASTIVEIVAVGPGRWREDEHGSHFCRTVVRPGQKVLIGKYVDGDFEYEGERLVVIQEADIRGVLVDA